MAMTKTTIALSEGWKYTSYDGSGAANSGNWKNAQPLPTSIHLDLLANGAIPDPFTAKNEQLVQWVGAKTWVYEKQFTVTSCLLSEPNTKVDLVLQGLDTYATIILNGKTILETDNMFLSHRINIAEQVRAAEDDMNTLRIVFHNAGERAAEEIEKHPEYSWFSFHFGNRRLAVRKAQYHFVRIDRLVIFFQHVKNGTADTIRGGTGPRSYRTADRGSLFIWRCIKRN
jgi:beta-mannosidase